MKRVLVSTAADEETVAIVDKRGNSEVFSGPDDDSRYLGNIYRGRVVTVDPKLQAAFIDFGLHWDGFLHVTNVHPAYGQSRRDRPLIQDLLSEEQEVLVQLNRDRRRSGDFALTTNISLPGRYVVLMPGTKKLGVSKKIVDQSERRRLRDILLDLDPPRSLGYVIRTEGVNSTPADIGRDLDYLLRLWRQVHERTSSAHAPEVVYSEHEFIISRLRDFVDGETTEIVCDDSDLCQRLTDFMPILKPSFEGQITFHDSSRPLLQKFGVSSR